MKLTKVVLIAFGFLLTVLSTTLAQTVLDVTRLSLMNPSNRSISLVWGEGTSKCAQVFGQPSNITSYQSEVDEATVTVYHYGSNTIDFIDDKMVGYELSSPTIEVGTVNSQGFKINDRASVTYTQVPKDQGPGMPGFVTEERHNFRDFPVTKASGQSRGKNFERVSVAYIKNGGTRIDSRFELLFDTNGYLKNICLSN